MFTYYSELIFQATQNSIKNSRLFLDRLKADLSITVKKLFEQINSNRDEMRVQFKYDESGKLGKIYLKFSSPVLKINRKLVWKIYLEKNCSLCSR